MYDNSYFNEMWFGLIQSQKWCVIQSQFHVDTVTLCLEFSCVHQKWQMSLYLFVRKIWVLWWNTHSQFVNIQKKLRFFFKKRASTLKFWKTYVDTVTVTKIEFQLTRCDVSTKNLVVEQFVDILLPFWGKTNIITITNDYKI